MQSDFFAMCRKELDVLVDRMRNRPSMTSDRDRERARALRLLLARTFNDGRVSGG